MIISDRLNIEDDYRYYRTICQRKFANSLLSLFRPHGGFLCLADADIAEWSGEAAHRSPQNSDLNMSKLGLRQSETFVIKAFPTIPTDIKIEKKTM